jgi:hypothetical protein
MQFQLTQDKETKGSIRYNDGKGHNLYFTKVEAETLGTPAPKTILVNIEVVAEPAA